MMPSSAPVKISSPVAPATPAYQPKTQSQAMTKAMLCPTNSAGLPMVEEGVKFQFNPKGIKVTHGAGSSELGVREAKTNDPGQKPGDSTPGVSSLTSQQELEKQGKTSLSMDSIVFDGAVNVQTNCGMLLNWSYPLSRSIVTKKGNQAKQIYLQELVFVWGDFSLGEEAPKTISVTMTSCTVSYERFSPTGLPIRASVSLSLQPTSSNPTKQNPTSGGLPDRRGRLLISGDSLPSVAVAEYGKPGEWRTLAEANELDDPLRVRPGMRLYLPGRAELAGRS
ncbi:MAG TPA: hypothetical protein VGI74_17220 [Streptosporangiaceae bacterium]|jgi:hypothetical protein